jgi:hypothetical protein
MGKEKEGEIKRVREEEWKGMRRVGKEVEEEIKRVGKEEREGKRRNR